MLKFFMKCTSIILLLFFGVLLGMQQANEGMLKMKGYEDHSFEGAFDIEKDQAGQIEAAVLGNKITAHDLKEKQNQLEELKAFNFFSSLGTKIAEIVTNIFQVTINILFEIIDRILSLFNR